MAFSPNRSMFIYCSVILLLLLICCEKYRKPQQQKNDLIRACLNIVRTQQQEWLTEGEVMNPEDETCVKDSMFLMAVRMPFSKIDGFINCTDPFDQSLEYFIISSTTGPSGDTQNDPAATAVEVLSNARDLPALDNTGIEGFVSAWLIALEARKTSLRLNGLIRFLSHLDCPLTLNDTGLSYLSMDRLEELFKEISSRSHSMPYRNDSKAMLEAVFRLDSLATSYLQNDSLN